MQLIRPSLPVPPPKRPAKVHPLAAIVRRAWLAERKRQLERTDIPVWAIQAVSVVLRCTVDKVRRIPRQDLPYTRVGKCNLYLPGDVIGYVQRLRNEQAVAKTDLSVFSEKLDLLADSVRKRSQTRRTK